MKDLQSIEVKNIEIFFKYVYDNTTPVISCKNIKLDIGKINCLVGISGSGKTLISKLLIGSLDEKIFNIKGKIILTFKNKKMIFNNYSSYVRFSDSLKKEKFFGLITQSSNIVFSPLAPVTIGNFTSYEISIFEYLYLFSYKKKNFKKMFLETFERIRNRN